ncbi:MAG: GTP cyclohydrolase 1 type 2 [Chlamydiales bacterium]|nr:GTP cyclohydrolase 1 type 2 [Chlamydiales bacterium]MCH9634905.1 GTP cyclohydrolase 1 type 2 [Chlamydiales bacterium]MCH9704117.1 Nif3-like dinuclear metal center hexameric protein [Chlamydiota bacterium]
MKRKEFADHLAQYLQADEFADYCTNGLQVEGKEEIETVATAVSANLLTIEKAIEADIDALVVHHGIFWKGDPYPVIGAKKRKLQLLFEAGINLFGFHLPLDAHPDVGNNWTAARQLGWKKIESALEIGVKGELAPTPIEKVVEQLESFYGHKANAALFGPKEVRSATLVSGGAWRRLLDVETDLFITGNCDEPAFGWAQELGKHFISMGHSATEEVGPQALSDYIKKKMKLSSQFIEVKNPF